VAIAVDVPDEDRLASENPRVNDGARIHRPQSMLEVIGGGHAVIDEHLCELAKDLVINRIDDQRRLHLPPVYGPKCRPAENARRH
jgi:hypothetical protein